MYYIVESASKNSLPNDFVTTATQGRIHEGMYCTYSVIRYLCINYIVMTLYI